ncbi:MAG TPA: hypothetical protein VEC39_01415 [Vicinamibacterales bacterium]|nr:hypothetical protein [Vicinamibacterales bacterium]
MGGASAQQCPRGRPAKIMLHALAGLQTDQREACHQCRVSWNPDRAKHFAKKLSMLFHEWRYQINPAATIRTEDLRHVGQPPRQHRRRTIVERMRKRRGRRQPLDAVVSEVQPVEDRRGGSHWMDRTADIMSKSGQRQRLGAATTANGLAGFQCLD